MNILFLVWMLLIPVASLASSDEDFLKAMQEELERFYGEFNPFSATPVDQEREQKKKDFENLLKRRYRGSYAIYQQLLDKDKEEIFNAFDEGMSMFYIKRMIIDRRLHE